MILFGQCGRVRPRTEPQPDPLLFTPAAGNCTNCHDESSGPLLSSVLGCEVENRWPQNLTPLIPELSENPSAFSWWRDENRMRTILSPAAAREELPVQLRYLSISANLYMRDGTVIRTFVTGDDDSLSLTGFPLLEVDDQSSGVGPWIQRHAIGTVNVYVHDGHSYIGDSTLNIGNTFWIGDGRLTTNSLAAYLFKDPRNKVVDLLPVAFDSSRGQTRNLAQYEASPGSYRAFPYFLELAQRIRGDRTPHEISYARLYRDVSDLLRLQEEHPNLSPTPSNLDHGSIGIAIEPESIRLPNFSLEFDRRAHREVRHFEPPTPVYNIFNDPFPEGSPAPRFVFTAHGVREVPVIDPILYFGPISPYNPIPVFNPFPTPPPRVLPFLDPVESLYGITPEELREGLPPDEEIFSPERLYARIELNRDGLAGVHFDDELRLSALRIPGVVNLGPTSAHVEAHFPQADLHITRFHTVLGAFDVGQSNPRERGLFHVEGGTIQDGSELDTEGLHFPAGLHVRQQGEVFHYTANLLARLELELPYVGSVAVSTQLLASGNLLLTPEGIRPQAGHHFFSLRDLQITPLSGSSHRPWMQGGELTITDQCRVPEPCGDGTGFRVSVSAPESRLIPDYRSFAFNTFFPVAVREDAPDIYQPDFSFSNFVNHLAFSLQSDTRHPDVNGTLDFSTTQPEPCSRSYHLSAQADHWGASFAGLRLFLNHPQVEIAVDQSVQEDGSFRFEFPTLSIQSENQRAPAGMLQGALSVVQHNRQDHVAAIEYDSENGRLSAENVNLGFDFERIVLPGVADFSRETRRSHPQVTAVDVDGRLRGGFSMDLNRWRGRANLCLLGDNRDVSLRGPSGRRLADPLIAGTSWCVNSNVRVDTDRNVVWGNFFLDTTIDWGLLRYFGIHINMRERGRMSHNNLPYSGGGYGYIERLFFGNLIEEQRQIRREEIEGPHVDNIFITQPHGEVSP